ncbi:MAG: hypothetical protein JNG84_06430 [Archangium sp.]|nr:hypothetical protein [Archangium sp.]
MRLLTAFILSCVALPASARPTPTFIEIKTMPSTVGGIGAMLEREKAGPFRQKLLVALEQKLREGGTELTNPDDLDAMTETLLGKIIEDMAAPTDIWVWETNAAPKGDLLVHGPLKLMPGRNSSGFTKKYTVVALGKRIDRGYLNETCNVEVGVAKSVPEWHAWVETKGWGASLHPVLATDGVARVALQLLSPGKSDRPGPRHERPVWLAFFRQVDAGGPWELLSLEPLTAKEQRHQETNFFAENQKGEPLTDVQKQLVLSLRMEDVRLINPERQTLSQHEDNWLLLRGPTESPVTRKTVKWLDAYRASESPMVRAVAVLRSAELGGAVTPEELFDVMASVRTLTLQADALRVLNRLFDREGTPPEAADAAVFRGENPRVIRNLGRARSGDTLLLYKKGPAGWDAFVPKK